VNIQRNETNNVVDGTSLEDHNAFYWSFTQVSDQYLQTKHVDYHNKSIFVFRRFLAPNIMHTIHDDLLPLLTTIDEYEDLSNENIWIFISDDGDIKNSILNLLFNTFNVNSFKCITCFQNVYVGMKKRTTWYQYGFGKPQGPLRISDGDLIKKYARFISDKLKVQNKNETRTISLFSRLSNRRIINENQIRSELAEKYKMPVRFVRMEENSLKEQIEILRNTRLAIGMHGSLLIMAIFLPTGSHLLEIFPYGVPSKDYTPFKTMAKILGLKYTAIEIKTQEECIPDMTRISHLPKEEQDKIRSSVVPLHHCCYNPYWIYRIYQDTILSMDYFSSIELKPLPNSFNSVSVVPRKITNAHCLGKELTYEKPFNVDTCMFEIWIHEEKRHYMTESKVFHVNMTPVIAYVRCKSNFLYGEWSNPIQCK
jgi:protein O-mannose beta-1,4-N-acetylglucosaminyltransferase